MTNEELADKIIVALVSCPAGQGNFLWVIDTQASGSMTMGGWTKEEARVKVLECLKS